LKEHFSRRRAFFGTGRVAREIENGGMGMRILLAILAIVALVGTAQAQDAGGGAGGGLGGGGHKGRGGGPTQQKADPQKQKAIDEAYKSAINRIPDPKEKYDPWKNTR
jgi:hypothetical protein